jgi:hypothetical protein
LTRFQVRRPGIETTRQCLDPDEALKRAAVNRLTLKPKEESKKHTKRATETQSS